MLTVLSVLGVLAVLFVAAVVATREGPILADAPADVADVELPDGPLQPADLQAIRFGLAVRGYRMSEVDRVLDRVATELGDRDAKILSLEKGTSGPTSVAVPLAKAVSVTTAATPAAASKSADVARTAVVPVEPPLDSPPPPVEVAEAKVEIAPLPPGADDDSPTDLAGAEGHAVRD